MTTPDDRPDCFECAFRADSASHSRCTNGGATVTGFDRSISSGAFDWPRDFDPAWVQSCNGYAPHGTIIDSKRRDA